MPYKNELRIDEIDLGDALAFLRRSTNDGRSLSVAEFAKIFGTNSFAAETVLYQLVARNLADYKFRPLPKFKKKPVPEFFACDTLEWEAK